MTSAEVDQLLLDSQREDVRVTWLLRGIAATALGLALLALTALAGG